MGLLSKIRSRLFPPELCRIAKSGDSTAIANLLNLSTVMVIGADLGPAISLDADENTAIEAIESVAKDKMFDGIFKFEIDGEAFLPVFTDRAAAETFCGAYCSLLGHMHAYRLFNVPGHYIRDSINDDDFIVINAQYVNEVEVNQSLSTTIKDKLSGPMAENLAKFDSLAIPMPGVPRTIEFAPE